MSLMGGWSGPSDPLYESSLATDPQTQLLAAHPQLALVDVVQSRARYAAISVPCGAAASSRKSEQPYTAAPASIDNAVPKSSGCREKSFIVSASLIGGEWLEGGHDANAEHSVARVRSAVDAAILVADVPGRPGDARRRQRRIETRVVGNREEVVRLRIHSRAGREPPPERRGRVVPQLQTPQSDVRSVLDVEAADRPAAVIVLVETRVPRVRVLGRPRVIEQVPSDVRVELAENVEFLLILEDVVPEGPK